MKIKKLLLTSLFLFSSSLAFSQTTPIIGLDKTPVQTDEEKRKIQNQGYTSEQIGKLNDLLVKQDYITFYDMFEQWNVGADNQFKYLYEKRYDGHIPLYWLMAEYFAKKNDAPETHKWLFIATITTQQDASLCTDPTANNASQKLLRAFPLASDIVRKTPQYTNDAMREVIFFIQNLRNRSNPIWACNFGENELRSTDNILISKDLWDAHRKKVFDKFTDPFMK